MIQVTMILTTGLIQQAGGRGPETAASLLAAGLDARAAELVS